jgi:hypothetical protein
MLKTYLFVRYPECVAEISNVLQKLAMFLFSYNIYEHMQHDAQLFGRYLFCN